MKARAITGFLFVCLLPMAGIAQLPTPATESGWARKEKGMDAYKRQDYAACATILTDLVAEPDHRSATTLYNAACCQAMDGHPERAIPLLLEASRIDMLPVAQVEADEDLRAVRALQEWPALRDRLDAGEKTRLAGMDRDLRNELARRVKLDQDARERAIAAPQPLPQALAKELERIDRDNTAWAKRYLEEHGWPGYDLIGRDGSGSFFLLVQHADADRAFQKQALTHMQASVARKQASAGQLAYLTDRVLTGEGLPQRYGTQFHQVDGKLVPMPIEDAEHVDERRVASGLPTMAEYAALIRDTYKPASTAGK